MTSTVLIAHRGLDDTYPENTLPAFEAALDLGMGFEFDLAMTADQQLVVLHDDTVDRTTDGAGRIAQMSLAEVRELDAGSWKGKQFAGVKVPTFDETLSLVASRAPVADPAKLSPAMALHVRTLQPGIINMICGALAGHGVMDRTVGIGVIGQSVDVRRRFYEGSAQFQCSALAETAEALAAAIKDPYSKWIYGRFVPSAADVEAVHTAGKKLFVSGDAVSKDVNKAQEAVEAGPDAVLTWHPTELRRRLNS
ncbi:MAG: glycerophosphodiester phosphodiesterase family protein [Chloroflexi bacterium]|nr:glycerophosphodiester phosphodiesterase family protein [Chloroflexota bacterium]MDA1297049.1 glycerophosphodiester phosphodiesterase family protein [Chloroflexota bacterium]